MFRKMPRQSHIEENERIRSEIQKEVVESVRLTLNKALDRMGR